MAVNNIQFTKIEIQIVTYLFKHYKDRFNPRQLAKLLDINHAHANKLCNNLTIKKLLLKEEIGNSIYYAFNYDDAHAIKFIEYMLSLEEFPEWLVVLKHQLEKFKPSIQLGLVFGSSIKSKDYNDIDILLLYDPKQSTHIKEIKAKIRKSELLEKPIRYVDISDKDILANKQDKVFYSIISDSLVFHNPEKYVKVIKRCRR